MAEDAKKNQSRIESGDPRILIFGAAGQLGVELQRAFAASGRVTAVDRSSGDLENSEQIRALIRSVQPEIILNAAAYTAVDRAESEPERANAINAGGPRILAEEALKLNGLLVHYSTDYVFDGTGSAPWMESDSPHPLNTYGASKLAGEQAIQSVGCRHLIFRTSWVYAPHGKNFLLTMLRLGRERDKLSVVNDQIGAPTSSIELARATHAIVSGILAGRYGVATDWTGLYHMTCAGSTSWFGFAQAIFARAAAVLGSRAPELMPIPTASYPTPAARPRNSVLANHKLLERFAVQLAPWESALDEVIDTLSDESRQSKT
ncbi:MAG TPA: dTDP-4-dehydrorhamnose reductase [Terracidiphilus sp.]|jgi:dTDP-4-dehydrorhamnose reductase|nr:dTDP-4-dehydrorhamnose reductase [Terracidiphilus sp.]